MQYSVRKEEGSGTNWDLWSSVYPLNCIFHPHCFILLVQMDWFLVFPNSRLPRLGKLLGLDPNILPTLAILSPWAWTTCLHLLFSRLEPEPPAFNLLLRSCPNLIRSRNLTLTLSTVPFSPTVLYPLHWAMLTTCNKLNQAFDSHMLLKSYLFLTWPSFHLYISQNAFWPSI